MRWRAVALLLLLPACGADMSAVTEAVPRFNAMLPVETFVQRFGPPCRIEPERVGERWLYCMTPARTIAQCAPGCEERAAYAWNGAVTWGP